MATCDPLIITEFKTWVLSPGDIFYQISKEKNIRLYRPGDIIDHKHFLKYLSVSERLFFTNRLDQKIVNEGRNLLAVWQEQVTCKEQRKAALNLLSWIKTYYWNDIEKSGLLEMSFVLFDDFFALPDVLKILKEKNVSYFKRSLVTAAIGSFLLIGMGYYNPQYIRDFYNTHYLLDLKIIREFSSFNIWQEFETLRTSDTKGPKGLEEDRPLKNLKKRELEIVLDHVQDDNFNSISIEPIKNFSLIKNMISSHHEKINGEGFPLGLKENNLSDLECVLIFSNNLIPYQNFEFKEGDGREFFKNILIYNDRDKERTLGLKMGRTLSHLFKNLEEAA